MKTLSLTVKELQTLKALRDLEIANIYSDLTFIQDAWPSLKEEGLTSQGFASLVGHLERKGAFWHFEVGDGYAVMKGATLFVLHEDARVLADNN